jgi:hypothetical protein
MMCLAPSCRATLLNFLWRQTSGVTEEVCFPAVGTVGLSLADQGT